MYLILSIVTQTLHTAVNFSNQDQRSRSNMLDFTWRGSSQVIDKFLTQKYKQEA